MRQKKDVVFASLLNRLRKSQHTMDDIKLLKTRLINKDLTSPGYPLHASHTPREDAGGFKSRIRPPYPQRVVKGD